jgi:predicted membrane channel-forming protein YqfA (hemolysin III family)
MTQMNCYNVFIFVCVLGLSVVPMEVCRLRQLYEKAARGEESKGWSSIDIMHVVRYLVMGWACLMVLPTMSKELPLVAIQTMTAGGIVYTSGVYFFVTNKIEFHLAIWHAFVLFASMCFYLANLFVLVGLPKGPLQESRSLGQWYSTEPSDAACTNCLLPNITNL